MVVARSYLSQRDNPQSSLQTDVFLLGHAMAYSRDGQPSAYLLFTNGRLPSVPGRKI